ncbi:glycerophosphoryl diester phosphodiesterase membrane domain-containing protein [Phycicoccus sp. Root101]|uniref:glycerophosphoryl diester phosphodiesterase membrane domain-containing protein n=1 Tax=Phycicoccus sp. Root101 TaxID=1736421 RepID=UPI000A9E5B44|nr:glycerophosphoryl diester phosphodiesterase membrane domain-containing protein [Phycicoccus sp. Root101]
MSDTDGGAVPPDPSTPVPPSWSAPGSSQPPSPGGSGAPAPPVPPPGGPTYGASPGYGAGGPAFGAGAGQPAYGPPAGTPTGTAGAPAPHWSTALTAHKPGIVALRPSGFGDILEGSFAAMRRNPRTFFGLALLTSLVILLILAAVGALGYLAVTQIGSSQANDVLLAVGTIGGFTLLFVASSVTSVALTGMLSYPVAEAVLGRKPSIGETWRRTRGMLLRLAGLTLVLFIPVLVVIAGLVAVVILAFDRGSNVLGTLGIFAILGTAVAMAFLGVRLALSTPALVLEDLGAIASLRRSWALTRGRFWRTLGVLLVSGLIVGVVQQVLGVGFQVVGGAVGFGLGSTMSGQAGEIAGTVVVLAFTLLGSLLATLLSQPFQAAVGTLLYTDARIRKEGFDLALVRAATGARVSG